MATILVIEDDIATLNLITWALESYKHHVYSASTGEYALSVISQIPFKLVITDIKLKESLSGLDIRETQ